SQQFNSSSMIGGTINTNYNFQLRLVGGTAPHHIQKQVGSWNLPTSLATNFSPLAVSGTPLENGSYNPDYVFADAAGNTLQRTTSLTIGNGTSTIGINTTNGFR